MRVLPITNAGLFRPHAESQRRQRAADQEEAQRPMARVRPVIRLVDFYV